MTCAAQAGVPPLLVQTIAQRQQAHAGNLLEALWGITNLASGDARVSQSVLAAAPHCIAFLASGGHQLQEQAAWALGNLAGGEADARRVLWAQGAVPPLVRLLKVKKLLFAYELLCMCISHSSSPPASMRTNLLLHTQNEDKSVTSVAAWALSNLVKGEDAPRMAFLEAGVLEGCLCALGRQHLPLTIETAWILAGLARGEVMTQLLFIPPIHSYSTPLHGRSGCRLCVTPSSEVGCWRYWCRCWLCR